MSTAQILSNREQIDAVCNQLTASIEKYRMAMDNGAACRVSQRIEPPLPGREGNGATTLSFTFGDPLRHDLYRAIQQLTPILEAVDRFDVIHERDQQGRLIKVSFVLSGASCAD